jgi:hypothetical protein
MPSGSGSYQLRGGVETSVSWPRIESRLVQKAQQAAAAGGGWLRVDVRDGTWQFTPWARAGLRDKIDQVTDLIRPAVGQVRGIAGAVLSNSSGLAQGQFYGESARTEQECYGIRRPVPAARVRESMIVPVSPRGRDEARSWLELYGAEDSWLDWALDLARLPRRVIPNSGLRGVLG